MNLKFILIIQLILIENAFSYYDQSWQWNWTCNKKNGQCQKLSKSVTPKGITETPVYSSQTVCRLTCGKYGALWPIPTISTFIDTEIIYFHPSSMKYYLSQTDPAATEFFTEIANIFNTNLERECGINCVLTANANITVYADVKNVDINLHPNTDESYQLEITTTAPNVLIKITSENLFGARHAFETLSQLIASYKSQEQPEYAALKSGLAMVANAKINDKPIFKHRGLLLDTSRNYLTISSIKKQIDGMAASKMNVLHWHATDSQSFPIVFKRVPQMSRFGAYSSEQVYHLVEIAELLKYAKYRGVRIIFELDQPSHAGNGWQWGPQAGLGNLAVCINQIPWRQYCIQPPCGQLNPANHKVYNVLSEMYKDILDVFPSSEYFHMGGDEVFINCWNATTEVTNYMAQQGLGRTMDDFLQLWAEFQEFSKQAFDNVIGHNKTPIIVWSSHLTEAEHIEKYLSKNRYVIQTWVPTTNELPKQLLEKGYRLIISTKNAWYFDHGFWGNTQYYNWRTVYKNRIPRHEGVIGGEACMWGEYVDENSIDTKIWPRAAAVAERLWADPSLDTGVVESRFYRHRERLINRGINADAVAPRWCYQNEGQCR